MAGDCTRESELQLYIVCLQAEGVVRITHEGGKKKKKQKESKKKQSPLRSIHFWGDFLMDDDGEPEVGEDEECEEETTDFGGHLGGSAEGAFPPTQTALTLPGLGQTMGYHVCGVLYLYLTLSTYVMSVSVHIYAYVCAST